MVLFDFHDNHMKKILFLYSTYEGNEAQRRRRLGSRSHRKWWHQDSKSSLCNSKLCVFHNIAVGCYFPIGLEYALCSPCLKSSGLHFCDFVNLGKLLNCLSLSTQISPRSWFASQSRESGPRFGKWQPGLGAVVDVNRRAFGVGKGRAGPWLFC